MFHPILSRFFSILFVVCFLFLCKSAEDWIKIHKTRIQISELKLNYPFILNSEFLYVWMMVLNPCRLYFWQNKITLYFSLYSLISYSLSPKAWYKKKRKEKRKGRWVIIHFLVLGGDKSKREWSGNKIEPNKNRFFCLFFLKAGRMLKLKKVYLFLQFDNGMGKKKSFLKTYSIF